MLRYSLVICHNMELRGIAAVQSKSKGLALDKSN